MGAKVAVIGAGGLGSPILQYLAAAGIGSLTIIDPDVVEESNLQRQVIHSEKNLGEPKVTSAAHAVTALNSAVHIDSYKGTLTPSNALDILAGHNLVLDGTDNFPTRYLVSDACEILNLPLVWGSILGFHGQVSVFWDNAGTGVTYRDIHPTPPRPGEVPSCSQAGVLGMLVGVIGSTMAMEAVKVLTGIGTPLYGRVKLYDALSGNWTTIDVERTPGRPTVTQIEDLVHTCGFPAVEGEAAQPGAPLPPSDIPGNNDAQATSAAKKTGEPEILTPREALTQARDGRTLIDIREDTEVALGKLPESIHVPRTRLVAIARGEAPGLHTINSPRDIEGAIVYCQGGMRSATVQEELANLGIHVADMAGGYAAATTLGSE